MEKKLIDLYKEWMGTGRMTTREGARNYKGGLCYCLPIQYLKHLDLFTPDDSIGYWAGDISRGANTMLYEFNELRQFIVLLICAMCDEL